MINIKNFYNKIGTQIALTVTVLCLILFASLNFIVINQTRDAFTTVIQALRVKPYGTVGGGNIAIELGNPNVKSLGAPFVLTVNSDGTIVPKPLLEYFMDLFQNSLATITILGVILSVIIGFLTSKVFTRTLNQLSAGMLKLRHNDYKLKLEETGTEEFDAVIGEFNLLTEELQRVETLRKDLISDTSHELKTPLTSLIGQLQGVRDGVLEMDAKRAETLLAQVERLNEMVEALQEFSRLRNKDQILIKDQLNLRSLIEEVVFILSGELKDIKVKIEVDKKFTLEGDKELIKRMLINLITNTIKYANAKNILIKIEGGSLIYQDDGVGISKKHLPYIFERFYRVEKSRNRSTGGLGLGLSIVKEIVESHGWKIQAISNSNRGLKFIITLS